MEVFVTPDAMRSWARGAHRSGRRIGVVPTMGALHSGHLELVRLARERADVVVVTVFVNPMQFNEATDFDAYPRPIDDDLATCERVGVDAVYAPTATTMYGDRFQTRVEPGRLADVLEGPMRPGHFRGVTTIVTKLFGATRPDLAVFGQKDYQQLSIVRRMVDDLDMGVEIVDAPIVRADDGVAMSSRNDLLDADHRRAATVLHRSIRAVAREFDDGERGSDALANLVRTLVDAEPRARLEYVEIVDADDLTAVASITSPAVVLLAAWFGDVRLIDNHRLEP